MSYTSKERKWFLRAYTNEKGAPQCAFLFYTEEQGFYRCLVDHPQGKGLEAHHITPTAWILAQEPLTDPNDLDFELGHLGIILCQSHHHVIHPDIKSALEQYGQDSEGFGKALKMHRAKAELGEVFWNNSYDDLLLSTASQMLAAYLEHHPQDPYPPDPKWQKRKKK